MANRAPPAMNSTQKAAPSTIDRFEDLVDTNIASEAVASLPPDR